MADLRPNFGNINPNTAGALNALTNANELFQKSLNAPIDRLERYAKEDELKDRLDREDALRAEALAYSRGRDELTDKRYDENIAKTEAEKNFLRQKESNTADALNLLENRDAFIANKISGEVNAARAGIANLEGQDKIDAQNQLDEYLKTGTGLSGQQWASNASNATNVDANALYNARLNKEKLANDRLDRAEDIRWREKEYNLNLMKARMSGEPKYKGQVYTDPKTGSFVTTRSPEEERVLAQSGWSFGKNPNAGKNDSTTGAKKDADKDYTSGYKKLEEKVLDYGSFDDSTALENLEMLKMLKINPNDVDSMITKIEANTAFDKTLNYSDMNKYGPQIKSSDGKLLPLGDGIELIKKEGYITVFENGKPVLYKPTETKAIEEKLKEVEKTSKAPESVSQKDIAPVKKTEDEVLSDRFISGVPQELITGNRTPSIKKVDQNAESYNSKSDAFKRDVSESEYRKNKQAYDNLYELRYK